MKKLLLAAAVLAAPLAAPQTADACAMRRRIEPVVVAAKVQKNDAALAAARDAEASGQKHTAIRLYEAVMNAPGDAKNRSEAARAAARLLAQDGQTAKAVARARRAVGFNAQSAEAQLLLGELLVDGEAGRAVAHLDRAAALGVAAADRARLFLAQARGYAAFGQVDRARKHLESARLVGADADAIAAIEASLAPVAQVARKS
ncbi:MAG: hypothetical protein R3F60_03675 [bacterium]